MKLYSVLPVVLLAALVHFSGSLTPQSMWFLAPDVQSTEPCEQGPTNYAEQGRYYYSTTEFVVSASGVYTIENTSNTFGKRLPTQEVHDSMLILYTQFNPANPLNNIVAANDDRNDTDVRAMLVCTLNAGITYTLVTTTFAHDVYGRFDNVISGPGRVSYIRDPFRFILPWPMFR